MRKHIMLALGATALGLIGQAQAATVTFSSISLGVAGPGTGNLNLGIFMTGDSAEVTKASGKTTLFDTNMGLAGGTTQFTDKGTLTGKLYKDPSVTLQSNLSSSFYINGGIVTRAMTDAVTAVRTASTNAASLAANITYASIGGSALTITDASGVANTVGGKNTVVKVIGDINIASNTKNLTINGTAKDWFIINVPDIVISQGSILLSGGITANHVLFNITGENSGTQLSVTNSSSVLNGTFLSPNFQKINNSSRYVQNQVVNGATINGALIGFRIWTSNGARVNGSPYISVPVPAAAWLFGSALGLLGMTRRKQHGA